VIEYSNPSNFNTVHWRPKTLSSHKLIRDTAFTKRWARSWSRCTGSQPAQIHLAVGCKLPLSARPAVIFTAAEHHGPLAGNKLYCLVTEAQTSYTAWWQRHIGVNNLPKVVTQLLPRVGFEPTTCWSQVQNSTRCATAPPVVNYDYMIKLYNVNKYSKYSIYSVCMLHPLVKYFNCSSHKRFHISLTN